MAWTDYSSTDSSSWSTDIGTEYTVSGTMVTTTNFYFNGVLLGGYEWIPINELRESYNVPGFDDGYAAVAPGSIANNIDEGSGGGGGGSSYLNDLLDVELTGTAADDLLVYEGTSGLWKNNAVIDGGSID